MSEDVAALQAEIAQLKLENSKLKESYVPNLKRRVSILNLMSQADDYIGKTIGVGGWVRTSRKAGGGSFAFLKVYDGTTGEELQVVVDSKCPGFVEVTKDNGVGASVFCLGLICSSIGKEQKLEMKATEIKLLGSCDAAKYPLGGKGLTLEYLRSVGHLRPRTMVLGAVSRIRNALAFGTHTYFQSCGFNYVHTPLITASDCEGGGEMFQLTTLIKDSQFEHTLPGGKADFSKDFFKRPAFLTVSGQLNAEIYATALSNVYTFGPTFRAEDSHTSRHLSEFWMIEPEIAFADLAEDMEIAENYLKFVINFALEKCPADMKILEDFEVRHLKERKKELEKEAKAQKAREAEKFKALRAQQAKEAKEAKEKAKEAGEAGEADAVAKDDKKKEDKKKDKKKDDKKKDKKKAPEVDWRALPLRERLRKIVDSSFARITYTDAITLLQKAVEDGVSFEESKIEWGMDLGSEHERYMCEKVYQRPTIVTDYPKDIKAFYMRMNDDNKTVAAMDILVPGVGELIGGSQREERYDKLKERLTEMKLEEEDYAWYMELRKFGTVPHSGFGAGFERLVCYTTGMDNIRDAIPFPRYPGHAEY